MLEHMLSGISEHLERLWDVMFDGRGDRGVWEEKAATAELLMSYLRANVDVLKSLGTAEGRLMMEYLVYSSIEDILMRRLHPSSASAGILL